jgi:hypothetical protein
MIIAILPAHTSPISQYKRRSRRGPRLSSLCLCLPKRRHVPPSVLEQQRLGRLQHRRLSDQVGQHGSRFFRRGTHDDAFRDAVDGVRLAVQRGIEQVIGGSLKGAARWRWLGSRVSRGWFQLPGITLTSSSRQSLSTFGYRIE